MGRHWRRAAVRCAAVVLAVAAGTPVASGIAAETKASAVPSKLVGRWSRNVTKANWKKYGLTGEPAGVWRITFKKGGDLYFYAPGTCTSCSPSVTSNFSVAGPRLTIGAVLACPTTEGVYGWKVSGRTLTLKRIVDRQCGVRSALFTGVWKRK